MLAVQVLSTLLALLPVGAAGSGLPIPRDESAAASAASYSRAVTQICTGALLFEGQHAIGTRAGALAVARDIRSSARRRLTRVAAVPAPPGREQLAARWIELEQRLARVYANSWLRIFDVIHATQAPSQKAHEPRTLERIVHAPDKLRRAAARLERTLQVPDCTGGGPYPGGAP